MEVWKDIKGYEGIYQISNLGRVKGLSRKVKDYRGEITKKERILTPTNNGFGYLIIGLSWEHKRKNFYIHKLVATAFIDNPNNEKYINHKDFNKKNNSVENLEWCSQKYNVNYSRERMHHPREKYKISNTGEKYISKKIARNKLMYRVNIRLKKVDKNFKTLEEAISYRNKILNGGGLCG